GAPMKLATLRTSGDTTAVTIVGNTAIEIEGAADVGALLAQPNWRAAADAAAGTAHPLATIDPTAWAPVVLRPGKIICAGLNYRNHILEMGRELPEYPTFFAKFAEALIGAYDDIQLPAASSAVDWEGELAVIIGTPVRGATEAEAAAAIAG